MKPLAEEYARKMTGAGLGWEDVYVKLKSWPHCWPVERDECREFCMEYARKMINVKKPKGVATKAGGAGRDSATAGSPNVQPMQRGMDSSQHQQVAARGDTQKSPAVRLARDLEGREPVSEMSGEGEGYEG